MTGITSVAKKTINDLVPSKRVAFTLAEVFSPHCAGRRKIAFTLAEVLITLGIIGVVAAMTIPTLVTNYKKKVTVTQLKRTYSVLAYACERAKAIHGDPITWDFCGYDRSLSNGLLIAKCAAENYILTYLNKVKEARFTTWKDFGYKYIKFSDTDNSIEDNLNQYGYMISLIDGTILQVSYVSRNNGTTENPNIVTGDISIQIDINGLNMPNTRGKDLFEYKISLTNGKFGFFYYGDKIPTRNSALFECKTNSRRLCGYLIMIDGWQIKDDYPWF